MPQEQFVQFKQQLLWMMGAIFVAVTASIITSTLVVTGIVRAQAPVHNTVPASTSHMPTTSTVGCAQPEVSTQSAPATSAAVTTNASATYSTLSTSYNDSHDSYKKVVHTTNVTSNSYTSNVINSNNKTNVETTVVAINDSFNKDSYNEVKQVNVNSNNTTVVKDSFNDNSTDINSHSTVKDSFNDNSSQTNNVINHSVTANNQIVNNKNGVAVVAQT